MNSIASISAFIGTKFHTIRTTNGCTINQFSEEVVMGSRDANACTLAWRAYYGGASYAEVQNVLAIASITTTFSRGFPP
jgi:hypothetical protein